MIQRNITAILATAAILAVALLSGCVTVEAGRTGVATPIGAGMVVSFEPEARIVPRAKAVNAQVARLLDSQQNLDTKPLVAAR